MKTFEQRQNSESVNWRGMVMTMLFSLCLIAPAGAVDAKPSLWSYPRISQDLFDLAVAGEVDKRCSTISARKIKGLMFAKSLFSYAQSKGYTYDEVKAFVRSDAEKAKLKARVVKWLKSEGVDVNNNQSFCPLGGREIEKRSQIGSLLKWN